MTRTLSCARSVPGTIVALLLLAASINGASPDQQRLREMSLEQLGEIEVTVVTKDLKEVSRTPAAIYVFTNDDTRRSGATSIPDLLRLVPGVDVSRTDSSSWALGIRGFGNTFSKSVLVLTDGRSVYTPLFAGVNWKLENVLLEDVDRIEVIRGQNLAQPAHAEVGGDPGPLIGIRRNIYAEVAFRK